MIVDDNLNDWNIVTGCRCKFIHIHTETAITCNIDDRFIRSCSLCSQSCAKAVSHRSQSTRSQKLTRLAVFIILCCPHLMLANLSGDDRITFGHTVDLFYHIRSCQAIQIVFQREFQLQFFNMLYPLFVVILTDHRIEALQYFLHIADHTGCGSDILVDLCRIYIDLQHLGILCKFCRITKYTITETGTYRNQKIAVSYTKVCIFGSMHTQHTCIQRMFSGKCSFTHQSVTYRRIDLLCKLQ